MTYKKFIVDGADAKQLKEAVNGQVKLIRALRGTKEEGVSIEDHAHKVFHNAKFWIAEPYAIYSNGHRRTKRLTCDEIPKGYVQQTTRSSGSRMSYGDHRFVAEVVSHKVVGGQHGAIFVDVVLNVRNKVGL